MSLASNPTTVRMKEELDFLKGYEPDEKRIPLNFRVPESLSKQIQVLLKLRQAQAEADGRSPDSVTNTYVCEHLLKLGLDVAWGRIVAGLGLRDEGFPEDRARVEELIRALKDQSVERKNKR